MTAEEKAKELVDKFKPHTRTFDETRGWEDNLHDASQCALIAVEEILLNNFWESELSKNNYFIYWNDVKSHLQNL